MKERDEQQLLSVTSASTERIHELRDAVLKGYEINAKEAMELALAKDKQALYQAAHDITMNMMGIGFDTCSIINVKSGNCPEDCKWCAQSKHFHTGAEVYDMLNEEECSLQAVHNRKQGIKRFSLVASGRTQSHKEIDHLVSIYRTIKKNTDIHCCASLGLLDEDKLQKLYDAGVTTYHCNMEASTKYFKYLVTTHTHEEKIKTIQAARRVGMRICSGGIIGMGESLQERINLALLLRNLQVYSIPINVLHAIPGTPLEKAEPLTEEEYLTCVALFRFINPRAYLRFSGGRIQIPIETVRKAMYIGINAAITGDMLTTPGARCQEDMQLIKEMGYSNDIETCWERPDQQPASIQQSGTEH